MQRMLKMGECLDKQIERHKSDIATYAKPLPASSALHEIHRDCKRDADSDSREYLSARLHCTHELGPNNQGERREAAAADVRFVSELNGCLPFALLCSLGKKIRKSRFVSGLSRITVPAGNFP
jgi:hypothetical protein